MSIFEYVVTLLTLVLGLGITNNLRVIAILDFDSNSAESYVSLAWLVSLVALQLDYWFVLWTFRDVATWSLFHILLFIGIAVVLFLAGAFLGKSGLDRKALFSVLCWFPLVAVHGTVFLGQPIGSEAKLRVLVGFLLAAPLLSATSAKWRIGLSCAFLVWAIFMLVAGGDTAIGNFTIRKPAAP
jgi:hypothetical protein